MDHARTSFEKLTTALAKIAPYLMPHRNEPCRNVPIGPLPTEESGLVAVEEVTS